MLQAGQSLAKVLDTPGAIQPELQSRQSRKIRRTYKKIDCKKTWLLKGGLFFFAWAILIVFLCITVSTMGYQIVGLEKDIERLQASNQRIEYEIAQKSSLDRIELLATKDLGMVKAEEDLNFAVVIPSERRGETAVKQDSVNVANRDQEKALKKIYDNLIRLAARSN
ncbi:hypothetical protein [Syntrophomonas wolfei]|jgi:cell division protein FtsB|uniref:Cell division protein FtsL n=1 Tax=Syntrophomonas wolfei subsp. wolfei (strain DSM 2245B / Goettingen) TaxID=335541 RepID=Q0AYR5_SYNWW|nr:hypothetical protein [Syntrophomonas wolfei]ABI68139.1 hypothetical protein Swol_0819 [Syntrophomonas wolfei subsp. wolfei str. Goettingen G311]